MSEEQVTLDQLIASAQLGEEAKKFLDSELGKVLVGLAAQEVQLARELFDDTDLDDKKRLTELKDKIRVGKWFTGWLIDLVQDGEEAVNAFKQRTES